jgi:hypothetical protein
VLTVWIHFITTTIASQIILGATSHDKMYLSLYAFMGILFGVLIWTFMGWAAVI